MKKFFKNTIIICIIILIVYLVLLIPPIDKFLTSKFEGLAIENPEKVRVIKALESRGENLRTPITYLKDDRLFLLFENKSIDISPYDSRPYKQDYNINESFKSKENCRISSNGRNIIYFLKINNENQLFRVNVDSRELIKIGDIVNSFALSKRGNIYYSTGYLNTNSVYIYLDEESILLGKNARAYYLPDFNSLVILQKDGDLLVYNELYDQIEKIDSNVEEIYDPLSEKYNYTDMYDQLTLYYKKKQKDYIYKDGEIEEVKKLDLKENIYKSIYENQYFHYSEKDKTLYLEADGKTYGLMRDVYKIIEYNELGRTFILASSKAVYKGQVTDNNRFDATKIFDLPSIYKRNKTMIDKHLEIVSFDGMNYYVTSIKASSFILNPLNAKSWLNKISLFRYKLSLSTLENKSFSPLKKLDVASTKRIRNNLTKYDDDTVIYIPRKGKDKGKNVTIISKNRIVAYNSFNNEVFDSIELYEGQDYIYFVTFTKKDQLQNKLYVYENSTTIMILKDNFKSFDGHSTLYLVGYDEFEQDSLNIYSLAGLQVIKANGYISFYGINVEYEN